MRIFLIASALVATLAMPFGIVPASGATETEEVSPPVCSVADSPKMTIGGVIKLGDAAIGRCVTVEGWTMHSILWADNEARYHRQRVYNDPSSSGTRMGLYTSDIIGSLTDVRVTGRVDSCEAMTARIEAAGGFVFLKGYCHHLKGMVLHGDIVTKIGEPTLTRLPAASARPELVSLVPMAAGTARERLLAAFAPLSDALRERDREKLSAMLRVSRYGEFPDKRLAPLLAMLTTAGAPMAALPHDGDLAIEVFGWREPLWADKETREGNISDESQTTEGIVCVGPRTTAEKRLWPIQIADTSIARDRPYVCANIFIDAATEPKYGLEVEGRPIREPA